MDAILQTAQTYLEWIRTYISPEILIALTAASAVMFFGTLIAIPFILTRLPADYFDVRVPRPWMQNHHPVLRFVGHLLKNAAGVVLLLAGIAMLPLPGQGLLTILLGISLVDFPGKRQVEAKIVGRPKVLKVINALRAKFGSPPLKMAP